MDGQTLPSALPPCFAKLRGWWIYDILHCLQANANGGKCTLNTGVRALKKKTNKNNQTWWKSPFILITHSSDMPCKALGLLNSHQIFYYKGYYSFSKCTLTFSTRRVSTELFWPKVKEKYRASKFSRFQCIFNYSLFKVFKSTQVGAVASGPHGHPMSSGRALEVQHLECPSFLLHLHFWKCALLLHVFKMKCNIGMKRGTRSKMMCKIRAHFPPIWAWAAVVRKPSLIIVKHFYFFNLTIAEWGLFWPFNDWHFND